MWLPTMLGALHGRVALGDEFDPCVGVWIRRVDGDDAAHGGVVGGVDDEQGGLVAFLRRRHDGHAADDAVSGLVLGDDGDEVLVAVHVLDVEQVDGRCGFAGGEDEESAVVGEACSPAAVGVFGDSQTSSSCQPSSVMRWK